MKWQREKSLHYILPVMLGELKMLKFFLKKLNQVRKNCLYKYIYIIELL